jgi:hypothetical protein
MAAFAFSGNMLTEKAGHRTQHAGERLNLESGTPASGWRHCEEHRDGRGRRGNLKIGIASPDQRFAMTFMTFFGSWLLDFGSLS